MVVVDYRGPRVLRPLVQWMDVEMFNRITKVEFDFVSDLSTRLGKHDMSELDHLEYVELKRIFHTPDNLARIEELKETLPCRMIKLQSQLGQAQILTCSK